MVLLIKDFYGYTYTKGLSNLQKELTCNPKCKQRH